MLAALIVEIIRSLSKDEVGLDIVAVPSMSAALLFGENLAAAVVALMYAREPSWRALLQQALVVGAKLGAISHHAHSEALLQDKNVG